MPYQITFTDELYHHGVKGQKWGVRRFQDKYGKLTSEGKKHIGKKADKTTRKEVAKDLRKNYRSLGGNAFDKIILGPSFVHQRAAKYVIEQGDTPSTAYTKARVSTIGRRAVASAIIGTLGTLYVSSKLKD